MADEIGPQRVGRAPGDLLARVERDERQPPAGQPDAQVSERGQGQGARRPARLRGVNKVADDLGVQQLQADAGQQQAGQQRNPSALRFQIGAEQATMPGQGGYTYGSSR